MEARLSTGEATKAPPAETSGRARHIAGRVLVYGALLLWTFICLFPIY